MSHKHGKRLSSFSANTIYSGTTDISEYFEQAISSNTLTVNYDGVEISPANTELLNFIGSGVTIVSREGGNKVDVYIPALELASHWNTGDGKTDGTVLENSISRSITRISTPSVSEGDPFFTGGWSETNQSATISGSLTVTSNEETTGFGGDSTMVVRVINGSGAVEETFITGVIVQNEVFNGTNIVVTISGFSTDTTHHKAKASVFVDIDAIFTNGGRYRVEVDHITDSVSDSGGIYTFVQNDVFYDTNSTTPSINGTVTIGETSGNVVTKHMSGIEYYDLTSQFTTDVTNIGDLNENTQATSQNLKIEGADYGLPNLILEPFNDPGFAGWSNEENVQNVNYQKSDWSLNALNYRFRGSTASSSSFPRDTWNNGSSSSSVNESILVDTYSDNSNNLTENFNGESKRLNSDYVTPWDSVLTLSSGEALVMGGKLQIPSKGTFEGESTTINSNWSSFSPTLGGVNPNYSTLEGSSNFFRKFVDVSGLERGNFTFVFAGNFVVDAKTDLNNDDLQVVIRRVESTDPTADKGAGANPLYLSGADYNFSAFDDGLTNGQVRLGSSSGNIIQGTFGSLNCKDGIYCEVIINNLNITISQITLTFA